MSRHPTVWDLIGLARKAFFVAGGARSLGRDLGIALVEERC